MQVRDVQQLLFKAGYYRGAIDGDMGPATLRAVDIIRTNGAYRWTGWDKARRLVAAGQVVLAAMGYEPGQIDGYAGHNTNEALTSFQTEASSGQRPTIDRVPVNKLDRPTMYQLAYPKQAAMADFYGTAGGPDCTAGSVALPFAFPLAWNTIELVTKFSCHRRLSQPMTAIYAEAAKHYGETEYRRLRLDLFGGCFNYRKMRGGTALSTHAYGAAIDLDPEHNQLRWGRDRAAFAHPDYFPFWAIVEAHGAVSLGRTCNFDWMHFQFATI